MSYTARQVASAVAHVFGHGTVGAIMRVHRGRPHDARLRWIAMYVYRDLRNPPHTYAEIGAAFGRDRTAVARGLRRLQQVGAPHEQELRSVWERLHRG